MGILTFLMVISADKGEKTALITFFSLLPFVLFGPVFGGLADRHSRKHLMIFADILRALLVIAIPVLWIRTHSFIIMVIWFFILGSLTALSTPAKMSIIANITDKDALLRANSLIMTTGMVATLVGTVIAGGVIRTFGIRSAFYINSFTYIVSALFLLGIMYKKPHRDITVAKNIYAPLLSDIRLGIGYISRHSLIMRLMLLGSIFSFISGFGYILILNYGATVLHLRSLGLGVLLSAAGFGMIFETVALLAKKHKINYSTVLSVSFLTIGIAAGMFLCKPALPAVIFMLFCAGAGAANATITLDTLFQRVTPDELRGKIFAARGALANGVFLISLLLVGLLIKVMPSTVLFGLVGALSLITALQIFLFERHWGYQLLRMFLRLLMKIFFNFKVSGLENVPQGKPFIFAGNHSSILDGVALVCAYPKRIYFLIADSVLQHKFWGWCVRKLGYIPVKRGGFNKSALKQAVFLLRSGYSIGIFPEGKISRDDQLDMGKAGVAIIARLSNVDVVPFAIEGAYEAWPVPKKFPRRFPIELRFASPIDTSAYVVPEELVNEVMKEIAKVKIELEREGYLRVTPGEIVKHLINIG